MGCEMEPALASSYCRRKLYCRTSALSRAVLRYPARFTSICRYFLFKQRNGSLKAAFDRTALERNTNKWDLMVPRIESFYELARNWVLTWFLFDRTILLSEVCFLPRKWAVLKLRHTKTSYLTKQALIAIYLKIPEFLWKYTFRKSLKTLQHKPKRSRKLPHTIVGERCCT